MNKEEILEMLKSRLDRVPFEKLPGEMKSLIDESIDSVLDGSIKYSNGPASNIDEATDLVLRGIQVRMKILDQSKEIFKQAFPEDRVTINYRGNSIEV